MLLETAPGLEPVLDSDFVTIRLELAGATLLSLPGSGFSPRMSAGGMDVVRSAIEAYGWTENQLTPPVPSAHAITEMDEALRWLQMIPDSRYILRRIVGARMLVHPVTEKHLFTWRRIGKVLHADYRAIQRWHAEAISLIVSELHRRNIFERGCSNGSKIWQ
jgi:hypothetical protein